MEVELVNRRIELPNKIIPRTHEDGFNDGMEKWNTFGDKAYMGFIPSNAYEKGVLDGFESARNMFMDYMEYSNSEKITKLT